MPAQDGQDSRAHILLTIIRCVSLQVIICKSYEFLYQGSRFSCL